MAILNLFRRVSYAVRKSLGLWLNAWEVQVSAGIDCKFTAPGETNVQRLDAENATNKEKKKMMVPGMSLLLKDIKAVEDHARACQLREEIRTMLLTREEVDVIESFRRFKAQESD